MERLWGRMWKSWAIPPCLFIVSAFIPTLEEQHWKGLLQIIRDPHFVLFLWSHFPSSTCGNCRCLVLAFAMKSFLQVGLCNTRVKAWAGEGRASLRWHRGVYPWEWGTDPETAHFTEAENGARKADTLIMLETLFLKLVAEQLGSVLANSPMRRCFHVCPLFLLYLC